MHIFQRYRQRLAETLKHHRTSNITTRLILSQSDFSVKVKGQATGRQINKRASRGRDTRDEVLHNEIQSSTKIGSQTKLKSINTNEHNNIYI